MRYVLLSMMLWMMTFGISTAEERAVPEPRMMFIRGGVLCDTKDELERLLTGMSLSGGKFPEEVPAGCGRFVPREPIPMMVTPIEWYQTPLADTLIAHFLFAPNMWEQYGWVAYEVNPEYQPASLDIDA